MAKSGRLTKGKTSPAGAIFGAAILLLIPVLLHWSYSGIVFDLGANLQLGLCGLFIALAGWARWQPAAAALTALVLHVGLQSLAFALSRGDWTAMRWVLQGAIAVLLIVSLVTALKLPDDLVDDAAPQE